VFTGQTVRAGLVAALVGLAFIAGQAYATGGSTAKTCAAKKGGALSLATRCTSKQRSVSLAGVAGVPSEQWAKISASGKIVAQSGGIKVVGVVDDAVILNMGHDVSQYALEATPTLIGGTSSTTVVSALALVCGGAPLNADCSSISGSLNDHDILAGDENGSGDDVAGAFYITISK
jgi:hypothetical protein